MVRKVYGEATGSTGKATRRLRTFDKKATRKRKEERGEKERGDRREEERGEDFGFEPFLTKKVGFHEPP
jgi:hypothetical protein